MSNETELSEREREILRLAATGASNKEIAQELFISTNTVKVHLRNVFAKIGVASRTEAALYAIRCGIAPPPAGVPLDVPVDYAVLTGNPVPPETVLVADVPSKTRSRGTAALLSIFIILALGGLGLALRRNTPPVITPSPSPAAVATLDRWKERAPLPEARAGLAAAVYENQIYAIAGETLDGVSGAVTRYDPAADQWTSLTSKPVPVADVGAALIGEKIYVPGGRLADGQMTDLLEVYDPRRDTWESLAPMPHPISAYSLASFEGRLYLFGGTDGENVLDSVYEYDPSRDTWSERTSMPTGRSFSGAAVAGGKIYVIGGWDGEKALAVNEAYYPQRDGEGENPWEEKLALPEARSGMGVAGLAETIYIIGGDEKNSSREYISQTNEWYSIESPLGNPIQGQVLNSFDKYIIVVGWNKIPTLTNSTQIYQAIFTISVPIIP